MGYSEELSQSAASADKAEVPICKRA